MHPYWSLLRLPATAALVWLLLPNAAFFTISATLGFAIVWWLLDLLPPNPLAQLTHYKSSKRIGDHMSVLRE